jgi:hypothetical protein
MAPDSEKVNLVHQPIFLAYLRIMFEGGDPLNSGEPFHISRGGMLFGLMLRAGLVGEDRNHALRRMAVFAALAWFPLFILSAVSEVLRRIAQTLV